jgi:hypothetical protein
MGFVRGLADQLALSRAASQAEAAQNGQHGAAMVLWGSRIEQAQEALANSIPNIKNLKHRPTSLLKVAFLEGYASGKKTHVGRSLPEQGTP